MNQLADKTVAEEAGASRKCHSCTMVTGVGSAPLTSEQPEVWDSWDLLASRLRVRDPQPLFPRPYA